MMGKDAAMNTLAMGVGFVIAVTGCAGDSVDPQAVHDLEEAIDRYPVLIDLQQDLMTNTCSPNPGVCHSSNQEPELHTLGSFLLQVDAPCNVNHPDPMLGWDPCEREGDVVELTDWQSQVAWIEREGPGQFRFTLRDPLPAELGASIRVATAEGAVQFEAPEEWEVELTAGDEPRVLVVSAGAPDQVAVADSALAAVVAGDPNQNGVFGAEADDAAAIVVAGNRDRSYLWRRLLGDVPGSRMPLANGPVTNAQLIALGCWIEGLTGVDGPEWVDYEACSFFADPPLLAEPAPDPM